MNNISLIGRLTADPELKYVGEKKKIAICNYTLAVRRPYAPEESQDVDFINCTEFGEHAEFAADYFVKGQRIGVIGSLNIDQFEDIYGENRYYTKIVVSEHFFADSPKEENNEKKKGSNYRKNH